MKSPSERAEPHRVRSRDLAPYDELDPHVLVSADHDGTALLRLSRNQQHGLVRAGFLADVRDVHRDADRRAGPGTGRPLSVRATVTPASRLPFFASVTVPRTPLRRDVPSTAAWASIRPQP
ncbi:hypothetical protein [Streptomyces sp. NPDC001970]